MKKDPLHQYRAVRKALEEEMTHLRTRLAEITQALGNAVSKAIDPGKPRKHVKKRAKNEMSLKEAALRATSAKPLTKKELLTANDRAGYKFTASNPLNSLNTVLYGEKAPLENKGDGKFGPKTKRK